MGWSKPIAFFDTKFLYITGHVIAFIWFNASHIIDAAYCSCIILHDPDMWEVSVFPVFLFYACLCIFICATSILCHKPHDGNLLSKILQPARLASIYITMWGLSDII